MYAGEKHLACSSNDDCGNIIIVTGVALPTVSNKQSVVSPWIKKLGAEPAREHPDAMDWLGIIN
jgi:hypothetical protein